MSISHTDPKKSSKTKVNKYTPSGYSLFTHCLFDTTKNGLNYYRGKDCMKKFCENLKEHVTKISNFENKKMMPLIKEETKIHRKQKVCYKCKKEFSTDDAMELNSLKNII